MRTSAFFHVVSPAALTLAALLLACAPPVLAQSPQVVPQVVPQVAQTRDLLDLGLEDLMLMRVSVSTLTGRQQDLATAAGAVYVLTSDDIARSPARNVPDLLRTVPGIQVAQIDNNKWAISARGFNSRIASRLLVIIDGRNLYSPTFATVFWDAEDLPLDHIDRIEVIRGAGATLWGANAVNGVIRITSKSSALTQGGSVSTITGNIDNLIAQLQYGSQLPAGGSFRVYARLRERQESDRMEAGRSHDGWDGVRGGFRIDSVPTGPTRWSLQGDAYEQDMDQTLRSLLNGTSMNELLDQPDFIAQRGANLVFNVGHRLWGGSQLTTVVSYDSRYRAETLLSERSRIGNVDLRWQNAEGSRHRLTLAGGYRHTDHDVENSDYLALTPAQTTLRNPSIGVYDDYALTAATTLGVSLKAERNVFTGTEYQPNLKFSHMLDEDDTLWAAATRSVRVPGRAERDGILPLFRIMPGNDPPVPFPVMVLLEPANEPLDVETQVSVEAGWRHTPAEGTQIDLTIFHNRYDDLRSLYLGEVRCRPDPTCIFANRALQPLHLGNLDRAEAHGLEVMIRQQLTANLALESSYSFLNLHYDAHAGSITDLAGDLLTAGAGIQRKFNAQVHWQPDSDRDATLLYRYVGKPNVADIASYHVLDLQYRWRMSRELRASVMLRNLGARHAEFAEYLIQQPSGLVEAGFHVGVDWSWQR